MLVRFHVPFDNTSHLFMLGSEPEDLAIEHAEGEVPGITFWALHGDTSRVFQLFAWRDFLPVGGAMLIGEVRNGHGQRWFLYEMPSQLAHSGRGRSGLSPAWTSRRSFPPPREAAAFWA